MIATCFLLPKGIYATNQSMFKDQNESLNNLLPKVCLAPLSANNTQVMEKDGENVKKERKKSFLSLKYPMEFFHAKKF